LVEAGLNQCRKSIGFKGATREREHADAKSVAFGLAIKGHEFFFNKRTQDMQTRAWHQIQRLRDRVHAKRRAGLP
jgi:hypothetical protein